MQTLWIIATGAMVAGFVQGLSGFAFSMVAMSFWAWSLDPHLAAVLAVCGGFIGQVTAAFSVRRGFDWKLLRPFVFGGLVGIPLGTLVLPYLDMHWFKLAIGMLLVLWCPTMLFSRHLPRIRAGRLADSAVGLAGGVLGGLGGFTGTLPTLWCTLRGFDRDTQRSVIQNFNLSMLGVTLLSYIATGLVTREVLPMLAVMVPAMMIPTLLGTRLYIGISDVAFRRIVLSVLTASGVALLVSAVPAVVAGH